MSEYYELVVMVALFSALAVGLCIGGSHYKTAFGIYHADLRARELVS